MSTSRTIFHQLLSYNLRLSRELRGWTREYLSEKANISTNFISEIEAGLKFPRPENLEKLCEVLGLNPWELFIGPDQTPYPIRDSFFLAAELKKDFGVWIDSHLNDLKSKSNPMVADKAPGPDQKP